MLNPLSRTLTTLTPAQGSVTQSRSLFASQLRERRELEHITPSVTQTRPFQAQLHLKSLKAGFARQVLLPASRKAQSGAVTGAWEGAESAQNRDSILQTAPGLAGTSGGFQVSGSGKGTGLPKGVLVGKPTF